MYISLSRTCRGEIQNFSNWHTLFVLFFFITFCSRCCLKWDTACRPTDYLLWAFLSPDAQEPGSWKKIYFGHSWRIDNHTGPFPQQGFCTSLHISDELGVTWQTKKRVFFFLAVSGASNFKHFKQLFMTLSGLGLLTMWELPRGVSYFVSSLL